VSRIEQSGRMSLRRPKPPIEGGLVPEEEEEVFICSPSYLARNAHAPYCHLWPARSTVFFHITS